MLYSKKKKSEPLLRIQFQYLLKRYSLFLQRRELRDSSDAQQTIVLLNYASRISTHPKPYRQDIGMYLFSLIIVEPTKTPHTSPLISYLFISTSPAFHSFHSFLHKSWKAFNLFLGYLFYLWKPRTPPPRANYLLCGEAEYYEEKERKRTKKNLKRIRRFASTTNFSVE